MKLIMKTETLTDNSLVYNLEILDDDNNSVTLACTDQKGMDKIIDCLSRYTIEFGQSDIIDRTLSL